MPKKNRKQLKWTIVYTQKDDGWWEWKLQSHNGVLIAYGAKPHAKRWAARRLVMRILSMKKDQIDERADGDNGEYPLELEGRKTK